jgi:hypothetical protein
MIKPTSKVQEVLVVALLKMARRPDLSEAEVLWLSQFAMHMIVEFSVLKSEDKEPIAT